MVLTRNLIVDKRVIKQLAESAIKKEPVRALVELITNSDDSYRRLESKGIPTTGRIMVQILRKRKNTVLKVIDQAEGLDSEKMDERVGGFGVDTSGLTKGLHVRGFFGRGLKEAILGLGHGSLMSVKDGYLYQCSLTEDTHFTLQDPVKIEKALKDSLKEQGIIENGTVIEITVSKEGVTIPFFDNLRSQLRSYFSLRDINSSPRRKMSLIEIDERGKPKSEEIKIEYKYPLGKEILNERALKINNFPMASFDVQIFKASDVLTQDGPVREGGILIKGASSIHDITLGSLEGNPYAEKLFGLLKCKYIDELIKNEEMILSDRRDGLDWSYPFAKELKRELDNILKPLVEEIRKEEELTKKAIENEKTRQRFKTAIEKINEIALKELGVEGEGEIKGGEGPIPPPNGFDFIPEYYHIQVGHKARLSLKTLTPQIIPNLSIINFVSDNESEIKIETPDMIVDESKAKDGILVVNPILYAIRVGSEAIITAKVEVNGYTLETQAYVRAVAKIEKKEPKRRKGKDEGGLFTGIEYDPAAGPKARQYFDRDTKKIKIFSRHPSIEMYLGPFGEGQDELHSQVLIAELVTEAVCREIARRKAENGQLLIVGERMDAINREHNKLINDYARLIHQFLVVPEARRKV